MIAKLTMAFLGGFIAHQTKPVVDRGVVNVGWRRLTEYTIGVVSAYPFVEICSIGMLQEFTPELLHAYGRQLRLAVRAGYFLAFLAFGCGTALAWLFEEVVAAK